MNFFSTKTLLWRQLSLILCLLTSAPATAEKIPNYNLASPIQFASISRLQWADSIHSATPTQAKVKLLEIMGQRLQNGDYSFNTAYTL